MRWESGGFAPDVISGQRNSSAGAQGIAQIMPATAKDWGVDPLNPDAALTAAARAMAGYYRQYGGDPEKALAAYNMGPGNLEKYGPRGLPETNKYIDIIGQRTQALGAQAQAPSLPAPAPLIERRPVPGPGAGAYSLASPDLTPNQIQEGMAQGLTSAQALAICGPAAATAFARVAGRTPTLREAVDLAEKTGQFDFGVGMHGPAAEVNLLAQMGVPARLQQGADWGAIQNEVAAGRPVIADTPGHYYVVSGYDPQTGQFDFGNSAGILRAARGRTKFRPDEIPSLGMGDVRATIFLQPQAEVR
jgi:hypothetical protein